MAGSEEMKMIARGMYGASIGFFLASYFVGEPDIAWQFFYAGVILFLTGILAIIEAIEKKK